MPQRKALQTCELAMGVVALAAGVDVADAAVRGDTGCDFVAGFGGLGPGHGEVGAVVGPGGGDGGDGGGDGCQGGEVGVRGVGGVGWFGEGGKGFAWAGGVG